MRLNEGNGAAADYSEAADYGCIRGGPVVHYTAEVPVIIPLVQFLEHADEIFAAVFLYNNPGEFAVSRDGDLRFRYRCILGPGEAESLLRYRQRMHRFVVGRRDGRGRFKLFGTRYGEREYGRLGIRIDLIGFGDVDYLPEVSPLVKAVD